MNRPDSSTPRSTPPPLRVVVAVLTFRREEMLAALLPLLEEQLNSLTAQDPEVVARVVVVDNDPGRSAAAVVGRHGSQRVTYRWEGVRGIAAARNTALDEGADDDVLVFVDDDERPSSRWLVQLLACHRTSEAAIVAGPVVSEFLAAPDPFVVAGGFFERSHARGLGTGAVISRAATNNLLLDLRVVRRVGVRFDPDFAVSGGEDSVFTGALTRAGVRAVWCAEAVVTDLVPAERLTRAYVLRRTRALSQSSVLAEMRLRGDRRQRVSFRLRVLGRESARLLLGLARVGRGCLVGASGDRARGLRAVCRALGALEGFVGRWPRTYG